MWLVGMMGSGKTTVGRLVALALDVEFYDTDLAVESMYGRTISEIWQEDGERRFREMERTAIAEAPPGVVAAAGGGAVVDPVNVEIMRSSLPIVWLRARAESLATRLMDASDRPLLSTARPALGVLRETLALRASAYESAASHVIDTDDRLPDDIAAEVTRLWSA